MWRDYEKYRGWEIDDLGPQQGYLARKFVYGGVEDIEQDTSLSSLYDTIDSIENMRERL